MSICGRIKRKIKNKLIKVKEIKTPVYIPTLMSDLLKGKTALITGGTSGIGYAIARAFLNSGADVIITSRSTERAEDSRKKLLEETGADADRVIAAELDISDVRSIETGLETILSSCHNAVDILVNNAGTIANVWLGNTDEETYDRILDTNLKGTYFVSQFVSGYMMKNKIEGNILCIASSSSLRPANNPYNISKWGERGLVLGMAKQLIKNGIVVNGIGPGPTATPMLLKDDSRGIHHKKLPVKRYTTAEEVANLAVFLVSDMARTIVGDIVYMTGGAGTITFDDVPYESV